jgi:hypothetical protein
MTYREFWSHYLSVHSHSSTRRLHFIGTALAFTFPVLAVATSNWWLLLGAPICGYGFAWAGHFFIEKNEPAAFSSPLWSLISDFRMFFLWCCGRLEPELVRTGVK